MNRSLAAILLVSLTTIGAGGAARAGTGGDPCGPEPRTDAAARADLEVAKRLLDRVLTTRVRVFRAYRTYYDRQRQQIIERNQKVPPRQRMKVPPALSDDALRATPEFQRRERVAHAAARDEAAARARVDTERKELAQAEQRYQTCQAGIDARRRKAPMASAAELLAIPAGTRLPEEKARLVQLHAQHDAELARQRTDKTVMRPILSAAICGQKSVLQAIDRNMRAVRRQARLAHTDPEIDLAALREQRDDHHLGIVELERDLHNMHVHRLSCHNASVAPLVTCMSERLTQPDVMPASCSGREHALELVGYFRSRWE